MLALLAFKLDAQCCLQRGAQWGKSRCVLFLQRGQRVTRIRREKPSDIAGPGQRCGVHHNAAQEFA